MTHTFVRAQSDDH